jgi:hypothetical protein
MKKQNKYYLLRFSANWADEMDIDGHCVLSEEDYMEFTAAHEALIAISKSGSLRVGTNEDIEFTYRDKPENEDPRIYRGETYSSDMFTVEEISESEANVLFKLNLDNVGFASSFVGNVLEDCEFLLS